MKLTFKTEKPTGKWKSFEPTFHYIKLKGKEVGTIDDKIPHKISITVKKADINEDNNPNCKWKRITLAGKFESLQNAKDFLSENFEVIAAKYPLYPLD